ncbi:MAG: hypothetical protein JWQ12_670 [Glaciihabitans sp.]|nr:hypothetical protein [Glaciihabitans sp.]
MTKRFYLSTGKLVGMFGTNTPKPLPVIGFYSGEDGTPQWVPAGFDLRAGRDLPRCTSVAEDPDRYDALTMQVAARMIGVGQDSTDLDSLARRLHEGGDDVRKSIDLITHELVAIATVLNGAER